MAVLALVATAVSVWLYPLNRDTVEVRYLYGDALAGVLYPCAGALLVRLDPGNRIGWVFAATGLLGLNALANQYAVTAALVRPSLPLADLSAWFAAWGWMPELLVPVLLPLLFPAGTLPSRRWRPVLLAETALLGLLWLTLAFTAHPIDASEAVTNPWGLDVPAARAAVPVLLLGLVAGALAGLASLLRRMRRSSGVARLQLQWLVLAVVVTVVAAVGAGLAPGFLSETLWVVAVAAIPAGVLVAVTRHRLFDVDVVLNRTLVYSLLTGLVVVAYLAAAAQLGEIAAQKLGVLAVALLALLLALARDRLQQAVDRALFGQRRDPYAVVDRVGQRIDAAPGPREAVAESLDELRAALRLPFLAVVPHDGSPAITVGEPVAGTEDLPIAVHGRALADLRVGLRHRGARLTAPELSVLHDAGRRLGALLQAATLLDQMRDSRERVVSAREEERRRLRHDLHDGVGPQLAGLALQLDSLGRRLPDGEDAARVHRLREQLRDTVVAVRGIVDELRPPALDDLGLAEALRQQVRAFTVTDGEAPQVELVAGPLPELPAAVEVAAYRIATEAVTNAVRHAGATRCTVTLSATDEELVVEVRDDGTGIGDDAHQGVGTTSMRERAAELGGRLTVGTGPTGTTVRAELPRGA